MDFPTNLTEEMIEGLMVFQQSMRRCLKSNDERTLEMQNTYEEQKSSMDEMIKQVSLLADIMKGIQEDRARSEADERRLDEEGVLEPEERELLGTEQESEIPLEKREEVRIVEAEPTEEESPAKEDLSTTLLEDETTQEIPEETSDEPQRKEQEVIMPCVGLGATLFYLQTRTVHGLDEKVKTVEAKAEEESASERRPPPVIDKLDEYREEEGPRLKKEKPRRRVAWLSYCEGALA